MLPKLKKLLLNYFPGCQIFLDCPKLTSFKTKMLDYMQRSNNPELSFKHPQTVTHLYLGTLDFDDSAPKPPNLCNLEYLSISRIGPYSLYYGSHKDAAMKILDCYPNLRKISILPNWECYFESRATLLALLDRSKACNRGDLSFEFSGILIQDKLDLEQNENNEELGLFNMRNKSRIFGSILSEDEHNVKTISYNGGDEIPPWSPKQSNNVEEIRVNDRVKDERRLVEFIDKFKGLISLKIEKKSLLQASFYRQLSMKGLANRFLIIQVEPHNGLADFEFIFDFNQLAGFFVRKRDLDDTFVKRVFYHFTCFTIGYQAGEDKININRPTKDGNFELSVCKDHMDEFENLEELLQLVAKIRTFKVFPRHNCTCSCEYEDCWRESFSKNFAKRFDFDNNHYFRLNY